MREVPHLAVFAFFGQKPGARSSVALAILGGCCWASAGFTFLYAEGLSYLSTDPKACANCHIMQPQYDSWQKASHHTVATCVDCHLPHDFIGKYLAKAENGYHHSKAFTLQDFHEPIMIKPKNEPHPAGQLPALPRRRSCTSRSPARRTAARRCSCVHCHRSVGHGETAGLGRR